MSRFVDDDFWQPPEDRERVVREQFARAGISGVDAPNPGPAPDPKAPARFTALAERDGFLSTPGGLLISPTLAEMLHYHPAGQPSEKAGQLDAAPDDLESLESMRRE